MKAWESKYEQGRDDEHRRLREGAERRIIDAMNYGDNWNRFLNGEMSLKRLAEIVVDVIFGA